MARQGYPIYVAPNAVDCAFKLYRKAVFDKFRVTCSTGLADAEIPAKARKTGARIVEVPVKHFTRAGGKSAFETGLAGKLGLVKSRVVIDLIREMVELKREIDALSTAEAK